MLLIIADRPNFIQWQLSQIGEMSTIFLQRLLQFGFGNMLLKDSFSAYFASGVSNTYFPQGSALSPLLLP